MPCLPLGREDSVLSYETVTQMEGKAPALAPVPGPQSLALAPRCSLPRSPPQLALCPQCTTLAPSSSLGPPRTERMMTCSRSSPTSLDPVYPVSAMGPGAGQGGEGGAQGLWGGASGRAASGGWGAGGQVGVQEDAGFSEQGCFSAAFQVGDPGRGPAGAGGGGATLPDPTVMVSPAAPKLALWWWMLAGLRLEGWLDLWGVV